MQACHSFGAFRGGQGGRVETGGFPQYTGSGKVMIERLDHVAIVVADTERALAFFRDRLGLQVVAVDKPQPPAPAVKLTYLATGSIPIQLVEPLDADSPVALWLAENGEGLHHICFATEDLNVEMRRLVGDTPYALGSGLGRLAAFVPGVLPHGTRIEVTETGAMRAWERRARRAERNVSDRASGDQL